MKCYRHPDEEAVAQCPSCGKYICRTCAQATSAFNAKYGTICIDCCTALLGDLQSYYQWAKADKIKKIIVSIIFYAIGAALLIFPLRILISSGAVMLFNPAVLGTLVGGIILCGFYTGISMKKSAEKEFEEYERKHGVQYTITENGIYREKGTGTKVFYFLCGTVLGVALTPFMLIVYAFGIVKNNRDLNNVQENLNNLNSL